jgi:Rieske Fe-S protein
MATGAEQGGGARPAESRRGFLKWVTAALSGLVGAVLAVPAVRFLFFPVSRGKNPIVETPDGLIPVAPLDSVGADPRRVEIVAPRQRDAWAKVDEVRLGAAWLVRDGDGVRAFATTCPHLGCAVDFDAKAGTFRCPCHTSAFDRAGVRISGPAKRGLDPLETRVEGGQVLVRFQRFKLDVPEREGA